MNDPLSPARIMETATAFWASKVLLTAVGFELFSVLGDDSMTAKQLGDRLELHPRVIYDFFDALVALKFLEREGDGPEGRYKNTPETATFLDARSPRYIGGLPEMFNSRLFGFWNHLGTALKTGEAQSEEKTHGKSLFDELYASETQLGQFLDAMSCLHGATFHRLAEKFDFSRYRTMTDLGGALALLSLIVAEHHSHLTLNTFDLAPVSPLARQRIDAARLSGRITAISGDFFVDTLPRADVVTMGFALHNWSLAKKKLLIRKVYDALPDSGAFIVIDSLIDDARRENVFGLLMSLNMLIEFGDAADYTGADFRAWCREAGFKRFEIIPLTGTTYAAVAYK